MDLIDLSITEEKRTKRDKETNTDVINIEKDHKYNYFVYENKNLNKWNDLIKNLDQLIREESPYRKYILNYFSS